MVPHLWQNCPRPLAPPSLHAGSLSPAASGPQGSRGSDLDLPSATTQAVSSQQVQTWLLSINWEAQPCWVLLQSCVPGQGGVGGGHPETPSCPCLTIVPLSLWQVVEQGSSWSSWLWGCIHAPHEQVSWLPCGAKLAPESTTSTAPQWLLRLNIIWTHVEVAVLKANKVKPMEDG